METLVPISRDTMKILKAQKDEEMRQVLEKNRVNGIIGIIKIIYSSAKRIAETTYNLSYNYPLPLTYAREAGSVVQPSQSAEFHKTNMDDILDGLRDLFPGCSVFNTSLSRGQDGKMYDISNIDEMVRPFINMSQSQKYIIIDWS
jgi:hypothetical protein